MSVSFLVPEYSENDKEAAHLYGINVIKAEMLTGYEGVERLVSPPESLLIDFVVGHGVVLGKQAQIIRLPRGMGGELIAQISVFM